MPDQRIKLWFKKFRTQEIEFWRGRGVGERENWFYGKGEGGKREAEKEGEGLDPEMKLPQGKT